MIKTIKLLNFRQHRDLTIVMTPGLNVVRGENEAGKSTVNEAIGYAFYGARFLSEPLDSVVTWGEKATTLKVQIEFDYDGVPGVVVRGKSGAEAKYGNTLVTGNAAVTEFFEKLFRASAQAAASLQIVEQKKVLGALQKGASEAVSLIEDLADFSLLEEILTKIQRERPCGNPSVVIDRIDSLKAEIEATVIEQPSDAEVVEATRRLASVETVILQSERELSTLQGHYEEACDRVKAAKEAAEKVQAAKVQKAAVQAQLAKPPVVSTMTEAEVADLRAQLADAQLAAKRLKAYTSPVLPVVEPYKGSRAEFGVYATELRAAYEQTSAEELAAGQALFRLKAARINETTCALCNKDLSAVPEVAEKNAKIDTEAFQQEARLSELRVKLQKLRAELDEVEFLKEADTAILRSYDTAYWELQDTQFPPLPAWKGPVPTAARPPAELQSLIAQGEESLKAAARDAGSRQTLTAQLEALQAAVSAPVADVREDEEFIARCHRAAADHTSLLGSKREAEAKWQLANVSYKAACGMAELQAKQLAEKQAQLDQLKQGLEQTQFFNGLIDKVRKARPVVANKLWALVLSAVSYYTTLGRGEPSTVTRDADGFKINGKPLSSYSGSAQDVLGLAVRLALVKTFLPSCPFLLLDEVAAACSDQRELQMLGMVAAAEIPQTLLVTHSPLAESYAANLIEL